MKKKIIFWFLKEEKFAFEMTNYITYKQKPISDM